MLPTYAPDEEWDATKVFPETIRQTLLKDPVKTKRPDIPMQGPQGKAGKISSSGTISQYVMQTLYKNTKRQEDPRDVLLAYE